MALVGNMIIANVVKLARAHYMGPNPYDFITREKFGHRDRYTQKKDNGKRHREKGPSQS